MFDDIFKELENLNYNPPLTISVGINKIDIKKTYIENYKEADTLLYKAKKNTNNSNIKGCPRDIYGRKFIIKLLKRYYI